MLEELSKNHQTWINIAYKLCKNNDLCNDLVQEMYLKLHNSTKEISVGYVYFTIKSIWIDEIRKNKCDLDVELKDIPDLDYDLESFLIIENQYDIIESVTKSMQWHEQKIIELSNKIGIRPLARECGISKEQIVKVRNKLKWKSQNQIAFLATDQKKKLA